MPDPLASARVPIAVPARWAASRLPGKLLLPFGDGTVLSRVLETAVAAGIGPVFALCDDDCLLDAARSVPGVVPVPSRGTFRCGTERVAAAAGDGVFGRAPVVVNLQADAVGATPSAVRAAVRALRRDPLADLGTVAVRLPRERAEADRRTTVIEAAGRALAFSRLPLPGSKGAPTGAVLAHVGVYAYRRAALGRLATLVPADWERAEDLEQLRYLAEGRRVALILLEEPDIEAAVDRPDDLRRQAAAIAAAIGAPEPVAGAALQNHPKRSLPS